jgi:hypothetical protein
MADPLAACRSAKRARIDSAMKRFEVAAAPFPGDDGSRRRGASFRRILAAR